MGQQPRRSAAEGSWSTRSPFETGDELEVVDATRERLAVVKDERRKQALERLASMRIALPPDYKFDREEANER